MSSLLSCWTCRLRKKKCDKDRPRCRACSSLEITCHQSDTRPTWMDGGVLQNDMTNRIKAEIKQNASTRRGKGYIQITTLGNDTHADDHPAPTKSTKDPSRPPMDGQSGNMLDTENSSVALPTVEGLEPAWNDSAIDLADEFGLRTPPLDMDMDVEMTFLDRVFPYLFPFYRPSFLEGGRGWLLAILKCNKTLYHSAMSLSSYFYILVLMGEGDAEFRECRRYVSERLASHVDKAIKTIQGEMHLVSQTEHEVTVFRRARLMESILQLLIFDVELSRGTDWNVHLLASISLFEQLIEHHGMKDGEPDMVTLIASMDRPSWPSDPHKRRPWNLDQGAFRFFATVLLYVDIVSSTMLNIPPRLKRYHQYLIAHDRTAGTPLELLRMEGVIGCQSWTLLLIADIATLNAQKKDGTLSHHEVAFQGNEIARRIEQGMADLDQATKTPRHANPVALSWQHEYHGMQPQCSESILSTRIWGHVAALYLFTVVSGWQPTHQIVRENVEATVRLLREIPYPAILRNLSWPFCVAGCLATKEQEHEFREMVAEMGNLRGFGTLVEALNIMERVWELRGELNSDAWDLSQCLGVHGTKPLLI